MSAQQNHDVDSDDLPFLLSRLKPCAVLDSLPTQFVGPRYLARWRKSSQVRRSIGIEEDLHTGAGCSSELLALQRLQSLLLVDR
jgi:hypothetical protein